MTRNLSVELRPNRVEELVGYQHIIRQINAQLETGRVPTGWLFAGPPGVGKTTIARIIAVSIECHHAPGIKICLPCHDSREQFSITEINAADLTGVNEMRELVESTKYYPCIGLYREIILDEAQRLSDAAQNLLLKAIEDAPESVTWIIATTARKKINKALQSRCLSFALPEMSAADIDQLLVWAMNEFGDHRDVSEMRSA